MAHRKPAEVFPPGEFLRDVLEERGWSQTEFAEIIGRPHRLVNEVIAGKRAITPDTAVEFAAALETSPEYWLNLESAYQLSKVRTADVRIAREAALRQRFPVREMMKRGWIPVSKNFDEVERAVLDFFDIRSIDDQMIFSHAARRNYAADMSGLQQAWIRRVRQLAAAYHVPRFSREKLISARADLERLMIEPEEIRHVPAILAACGVRLVIVETIPGSEISGVCFWLDEHSPIIGLSLKGDLIDVFWFNLWHELEHVLRGDGKEDPRVDDFKDGHPSDEAEEAANAAAANACVPTDMLHSFIARHDPMYSEKSFIGFSRLVKRHPGIVAGQIQRATSRWNLFKKYQVRVRHILIQTALTDGYGHVGPSNP